jgi:hypothetical protein
MKRCILIIVFLVVLFTQVAESRCPLEPKDNSYLIGYSVFVISSYKISSDALDYLSRKRIYLTSCLSSCSNHSGKGNLTSEDSCHLGCRDASSLSYKDLRDCYYVIMSVLESIEGGN